MAGIAFVVIGMYLALSMKTYINFLEESLPQGEKIFAILTYSIIVLGFVLLIVSFVGCNGLCRESTCMMKTFSILLSFVLIGQVAFVVGVYILEGDVFSMIEGGMKEKLEDYNEGRNGSIAIFWNKVQEQFTCCGIEGPNDWEDDTIPGTCCQNERTDCHKTSEDLHQKGCLKEFREYVKENMLCVGYVGLGIAAAQLFAIISGCCLSKRIVNTYEYVNKL